LIPSDEKKLTPVDFPLGFRSHIILSKERFGNEEASGHLYRACCSFVHGRVRSRAELLARVDAVGDEDVRGVFARMLSAPPALAIAGRMKKGASERARALFATASR